jgi:hypothetical protein
MTVNQQFGKVTSSLIFDIFALSLLIGCLGFLAFEHSPEYDELYHVLAARSWAQDGSYTIGEGSYTRGAAFTAMLGMVFSTLGESFQTAKLLPLVAAILLVIAVFLWVRTTYGRLAAWITALLFGFSPGALDISQFIRFYSFHALAIWIFIIAVYSAFTAKKSLPKLALTALVALIAWSLAYHLQVTTMIATLGLCAWVSLVYGPAIVTRIAALPNGKAILIGLAVLIVLAIGGLILSDSLAHIWRSLRHTSPWQYKVRDDPLYYQRYLIRSFPTLWSLFPIAALFAIRRNLSAGLLCVCIFGVAVVLHSLAGPKNYRYLHYAMPFFFVIWGAALAEVLPYIYSLAKSTADRLSEISPLSPRSKGRLTYAAIGALALFVIASNTAYTRSAATLLRGEPKRHWNAQGWQDSRDRLQPFMDQADVVATSNGLYALYYLDRYEIDISPSQVAESSTGREFGQDVRTGRYVISTPESLDLIMSCHASGLYISDSVWRWRDPNVGVTDEVADFLIAHSEVVEVPEDWMLRVYRWQRPEGAPLPENCSLLPDLTRLTKGRANQAADTGVQKTETVGGAS